MKPTLEWELQWYQIAHQTLRRALPGASWPEAYGAGALLFAVEGKTADEARIKECSRKVKTGWTVNDTLRVVRTSRLAMQSDPDGWLKHIESNERMLKNAGVKRLFVMGAAGALTDLVPDDMIPALAARAETLYQRMKEKHKILTGWGDIPFAIDLALSTRTDDELVNDMEECHRLLDERFRKSNALQSASHVLAMLNGTPQEKTERLFGLIDAFRKRKFRSFDFMLWQTAAFACFAVPAEEIVSDIMMGNGMELFESMALVFSAYRKEPEGSVWIAPQDPLILKVLEDELVHNYCRQTEINESNWRNSD